MTQPTASPPAPPPPPRRMTPLARRRCWTEPSVRLWWLLGAVILGMILLYSGDRLWEWTVENRLIQHGTIVSAKVTQANDVVIPGHSEPPESPVNLEFDWNGQTQQVSGFLEDRPSSQYIIVDSNVPIRVDPNDPTIWTYRSQITGIGETLFVTWFLLPIPPLLLAMAAFKKNQFRKTWQSSPAALAVVSDRRQTPIAPRSYAIHCSLADRSDKRLFVVYIPASAGRLNKGDLLWILLFPRGGSKPAAAVWFG
jgi:hypothetical protein